MKQQQLSERWFWCSACLFLGSMKDRIDPLIAERAGWLYSGKPGIDSARKVLETILGYPKTVRLGEYLNDLDARSIMDHMAKNLALNVDVTGLDNLPSSGAALIVANHPTGIADGIMVWYAIARRRRDAFFYANSDILRVLPQMSDVIAPVEWRQGKRSREKTRETLSYTRTAMQAQRIGVVFPSGRLAKRKGLSLTERPWMQSAVSIARKYDVPLIPLRIQARNSALFYLFDFVHPTLRDITLFHETLNKDKQPYKLILGKPIYLDDLGSNVPGAIETVRHATLSLGRNTDVSLLEASRIPNSIRLILGQT